MQIELSSKEFRRLLDLVYIGNWVLNSTRGDDRFQDYDALESKIFSLCPALSEPWNGTVVPSRAYTEGGIHEAIAYYEDNVFYEILAEELSAGIWTTRKLPKKTTMKSQDGWTNICRNLKPVVWIIWFWKKNSSQSVKRAGKIRHVFHFSNSASPARKMSPAPMVITTSPSRTILRSWSVTSGSVSQ